MKRVLITGGTGCIGAVTVHQLLQRGVDDIIVATRSSDPGLLRLWPGDHLDSRVRLVRGDVADESFVRTVFSEHRPSHVIHLGALQGPDCEASPGKGLEINVGGTLHLLAAASESNVERIVFASSAAVYGPRDMYDGDTVCETDPLAPTNLYGIWKIAGEHLARFYHDQSGIPTVCLRLNTTYGKGRDRGRTAAPTLAMKSIAIGSIQEKTIPFRMPYRGRENYHYVEDVGAHFAACTTQPFDGFGAFNILSETVDISEFLRRIRRVADKLGMGRFVDISIAEDADRNLLVCDLDDVAIQQCFCNLPRTPMDEGIRKSLTDFCAMAERGKLTVSTD